MKTKGSKSAPTKKTPKTRAQGAKPEVTIESGTTVVLPNPADAPASPKSGRKRKPEPTVATKTEVPDWAKRAATRDTAAEMAAVPEREANVTSKSSDELDVHAAPAACPVPKKGRPGKPSKEKVAAPKKVPAATPGSLRAIGNAWIESLRAAGHSKSTVSSYGNDLEVAYEVLDGSSAAADLTEKQIAAFNESKAVLKKRNGKAKAKPTILKTRRALRLALVWAEQKSLIKKAPFPAKTSA